MSKLAVLGGKPVINEQFPAYNSVGEGEVKAVSEVMRTGALSQYVGAWGEYFDGGPKVKEFESQWSRRFAVEHSVAVNSATSGLFAAVGAAGIGPGDEVIVPPYSMSATVMAPLVYGGIPVFADIEPETFCLDPQKVRQSITGKTKAIIVVNLFGHPGRLSELRSIADEYNLILIEDNAQSPLGAESGRLAGTVGHIGVFSLNYHKHIHTGEGGVCVTNDDELYQRLRLIRNHGENVVEPLAIENLTNLVCFNYRMTEICAAIGIEQLKRAEALISSRESIASALTAGLSDLPGVTPPVVRSDCRHVYYVWAAKFDEELVGVSRECFSKALQAEGFPNYPGYVKPLYMLPAFQKRIAMGSKGFPFSLSDRKYEWGMCPVVERLFEKELFWFPVCGYDLNDRDVELLVEAFRKVYENRAELKGLGQAKVLEGA